MMATKTIETYEDGVLVSTEEIEVPDEPAATLDDVREVLAATDLDQPVKDALSAVLDAIESP
jgi:hypothetical protein